MEFSSPLLTGQPSAATTASFKRVFHFVDATGGHSRRNARSHLVTERLRERRWRDYAAKKQARLRRPIISDSSPADDNTNAGSKKDCQESQRMKLGSHQCPAIFLMEPISCSLDPFHTLPVESSPEILQLVNHCIDLFLSRWIPTHTNYPFTDTRVIPSLLLDSAELGISKHEPSVDLFQLYSLHPASFLGMLYHSARHREHLYKNEVTGTLSLAFKIKALGEVNRQLGYSRARGVHPDNGTILAIYQLAIAERLWGDLDTFRLHWRAMYDIIDARGGAAAFTAHDLMYSKILWNCFALLNARDGYFNCPRNPLASQANYDFEISTEEMVSNSHCFVQSYTGRRASILRLLPTSDAESELQYEMYPRRLMSFQPGTVLHQVLSPELSRNNALGGSYPIAADPNPNQPIKMVGDRLRTDNCRLACIIYINLMLLELGDLSEAAELFLGSLERYLPNNKSLRSAEFLLWTLLRSPYPLTPEASRVLWSKTIQILAVVKRARYQHSIMEYQEAMFLFLELPIDAARLSPSFQVDLDAIQHEALRDGLDIPVPPDSFLEPAIGGSSHHTAVSQTYCELLWFACGS
ncbi:hypothetical protein N7471_003547 [Penicillium samsonianum]|uniref:uncharacterized protein n=1 Tax=Penicillium samsonianum TaxID=1882272 RepID=UPI00254876EE|nr:uncharacterized protein N7471_003547 [Penicillium samsonianum]KAJ6137061.1 hypothetical protein N7471_003547 [Penicillium samsonianum]